MSLVWWFYRAVAAQGQVRGQREAPTLALDREVQRTQRTRPGERIEQRDRPGGGGQGSFPSLDPHQNGDLQKMNAIHPHRLAQFRRVGKIGRTCKVNAIPCRNVTQSIGFGSFQHAGSLRCIIMTKSYGGCARGKSRRKLSKQSVCRVDRPEGPVCLKGLRQTTSHNAAEVDECVRTAGRIDRFGSDGTWK